MFFKLVLVFLGKAKINKFDTNTVNKHVVWLDIHMNKAMGMDRFKLLGQENPDLCCAFDGERVRAFIMHIVEALLVKVRHQNMLSI